MTAVILLVLHAHSTQAHSCINIVSTDPSLPCEGWLWDSRTFFQALHIAAGQCDPDLVDLWLPLQTFLLIWLQDIQYTRSPKATSKVLFTSKLAQPPSKMDFVMGSPTSWLHLTTYHGDRVRIGRLNLKEQRWANLDESDLNWKERPRVRMGVYYRFAHAQFQIRLAGITADITAGRIEMENFRVDVILSSLKELQQGVTVFLYYNRQIDTWQNLIFSYP